MPHTLLLAEPHGFCAGVVRAIEALNAILDREQTPVYVFHEIVHNHHVVEGFRARGAIFVESLEQVPEGSRVVFSAHGVSPAIVEQARRRRMRVIDATCPLVTKVHLQTRKAARDGYDILLVGHEGHDEVAGTLGEAPERTTIVETPAQVRTFPAGPHRTRPVLVVTQTTLSIEDTADTIEAVRERFPDAAIRNDICYATTNRQLAVRTVAQRSDLVLVVGSRNSSNSLRLREVAAAADTPAYRIDGIAEIDPAWYDGVGVVGLTAGASVPDELLDPIIEDLKRRGVVRIEPVVVATETEQFRPPAELQDEHDPHNIRPSGAHDVTHPADGDDHVLDPGRGQLRAQP